MLPQRGGQGKWVSPFQIACPGQGEWGHMLPPSHSAPVEGGRGRTFFQGAEEAAAAAAGAGSWIQMDSEGEAGASSPKAEGED